jgi:hypothetical protein
MVVISTVTEIFTQADLLRRRRYGVIETADGRFRRIRLRWFPKLISASDVWFWGHAFHRRRAGDRLWLYYNQPRRHAKYLVLKYVVSTRGGSLASLVRALDVLDEIARLKGSDALLCDAANRRVSGRLMERWGWAPHCPARWHRHFIKRFYGRYPASAKWLAEAVEIPFRPFLFDGESPSQANS